MSEISNFRFDVSVSESGYASKPTSVDYQRMVFRPVNVNMVEFMDLICKGHSFCHIYKGNRRSNANFMYTHIICIDVDKYHTPMKQFVDRLILKMPSMAYTTFSNGKGGTYSFRLIYCFNSQITYQYEQLYHTICCEIGLQDNRDNCGAVKAQLMNGNSLPDKLYCLRQGKACRTYSREEGRNAHQHGRRGPLQGQHVDRTFPAHCNG